MTEEGEAEIPAALERMRRYRQWVRANPDNPICEGCSRREESGKLTHNFCPECQDTLLFLKTGCRFGRSPCCGSDDCQLPLLGPHEEGLKVLYLQDPDRFDWVEV